MVCKYCGRDIGRGGSCICHESTSRKNGDGEIADDTVSASANEENAAEKTKGIFSVFLTIFKSPEDSLSEMVNSSMSYISVIFLGVKAIVTASIFLIMLFWLDHEMAGFFTVEKVRPTIVILTITLVCDYVMSWLLYLAARVLGGRGRVTQGGFLGSVGITCAVETTGYIIASLIALIFPAAGLFFAAISMLLSSFYMLRGFQLAVRVNKNVQIYAVASAYVVKFILMFLIVQLLLADFFASLRWLL